MLSSRRRVRDQPGPLVHEPPPAEPRSGNGIFRSLRYPELRSLLIGFTASALGDWIYNVALLVYVYDQTHSAPWVASVTVARLLPYAVLGPFAGAIASRFNQRRVMVAADLLRAMVMFVLAAAVAREAPIGLVLLLACLTSCFATPYQPTASATVRLVVPDGDLGSANALMGVIDNLALIAGPAIGGLLLLGDLTVLPYVVNGATFLLSALAVSRIRIDHRASEMSRSSVGAQVRSARTEMWRNPTTATLTVLWFGLGAIYGLQSVLLVEASDRLLMSGSSGVGALFAAMGVGGLAAVPIGARLADSSTPLRVVSIASVLVGLPLIALSVATSLPLGVALMAVDGAASITLDIVAITMLQRMVDEDILTTVLGTLDSVEVAAILAGSLAAPGLIYAFGVRGALLTSGALLPVIMLGWRASPRSRRAPPAAPH